MQTIDANTELNAHVHPVIAQVLNGAAAIPAELKRIDYVARLARLGLWCDLGDMGDNHMARDEEGRLRILRAEIDPTGELWNKHAPMRFRDSYEVRMFKDFTDTCPVTVEWVLHPQGAQVIAVVVDTVGGPKTIHNELSVGALARYQIKAEQLAAAIKANAEQAAQGQGVAA